MDKKLFLYLIILAALLTATFLSVRSSQGTDDGELTAHEMTLLEDSGHFEINQHTDTVEPLFDQSQKFSLRDLGNGKTPEPELLTAYRKFTGEKTKGSPLLTFALFIASGIFTGFLVVSYLLPNLVQRASEEVLGSSEKAGADPLATAQSHVAQGNWEKAIASYQEAAELDPSNRLPWVEIAALQLERLEEPDSALTTLNQALERGNWRENDEAFFIFRKIDIHESRRGDHERAVELLRDVIQRFPETRHSANANHKLRELGEV